MKRPVSLLCALMILLPSIAFAHTGATGIVKQRMDAMKDISDTMKQLGAMVQGKAEFNARTIAEKADAMKRHAQEMPSLFPKGSMDHPTEALPQIWDSFERFSSIASDLESAADALSKVTDSKQLLPALAEAGKTCKQCHTDYRKP